MNPEHQHYSGEDMNRSDPNPVIHLVRSALAALTCLAIALIPAAAWAQSTSAPPNSTAQPLPASSQTGGTLPAASGDDLAQMRTDLDRMESLLGNMSSEIEFLHDQNLQILLRTNAQIWTILIRDLRRQVDREQRARDRKP
jgi:hypothetical protein